MPFIVTKYNPATIQPNFTSNLIPFSNFIHKINKTTIFLKLPLTIDRCHQSKTETTTTLPAPPSHTHFP
ncbi:hypothetical protein QVD17_06439 [Tagetes erecta]|uniref:Uncharacterized protein n=1 Tax=Tagetes erecta TaxID=13708 RepID=A0AAD8P6G5_TARER|nr:hypothetical protein QVD17_06439 [Tagetes erecta]